MCERIELPGGGIAIICRRDHHRRPRRKAPVTVAEALLSNLRRAGFRLRLDEAGRVLVSPSAELTPEHRQAITRNRDALAELLRQEGRERGGRAPPAAGPPPAKVSPGHPVVAYRGWARINNGPWQIACREATEDACWRRLLEIPFLGNQVDRIVLPADRQP